MKEVSLFGLTWLGSYWVCLDDYFTCTHAHVHAHTHTSLHIFCWWFAPGRSSYLGLGLWSWREFLPVGVTWLSICFLFLGCPASQCSITQSDDRRSSARVMTCKPPWGLLHSPVIWGDTDCCVEWLGKSPGLQAGWKAWAEPMTHEQFCSLSGWALLQAKRDKNKSPSWVKCSCHSAWLCWFREVT